MNVMTYVRILFKKYTTSNRKYSKAYFILFVSETKSFLQYVLKNVLHFFLAKMFYKANWMKKIF